MSKIAIVSPSGNLYGSEQVLLDFLKSTTNKYDLYLPSGLLFEEATALGRHMVLQFGSVKLLYVSLIWGLLFSKYDGVYVNEAGHSRYINVLSRLFPSKKFYIHIRLLEDTKRERLGGKRENVKYISVSDYISEETQDNCSIDCITVRDLYIPTSGVKGIRNIESDETINVGIVGRVTDTKGIDDILRFCDYVEANSSRSRFVFHFFGEVNQHSAVVKEFLDRVKGYKYTKCIFHGFVKKKIEIYGGVDLLLHFNQYEPLGRIFFESLDYGLPFIGFNRGGIGEIARCLDLSDLMVDPANPNWAELMCRGVVVVSQNTLKGRYEDAKNRIERYFSSQVYTKNIEDLF
ncbi:MAG: glycosyltransferase [Rikenellaceae bacterium]